MIKRIILYTEATSSRARKREGFLMMAEVTLRFWYLGSSFEQGLGSEELERLPLGVGHCDFLSPYLSLTTDAL